MRPGSDVTRAAVSPDDTFVALGGGDGSVGVWEVGRGEGVVLRGSHGSCVMGVQWHPNGRSVVSWERNRRLAVWS